MPRLFIAIDIPESINKVLPELQLRSKGVLPQTQPHITLHYIGEVSEEVSVSIKNELNSINTSEFDQLISGVGAFTEGKTPHYFWVGVDKSHELLSLHKQIGHALQSSGLDLEKRSYKPHITIARLDTNNKSLVEQVISDHQGLKQTFKVSSFTLYKSELIEDKPKYTKLQVFNLSGSE